MTNRFKSGLSYIGISQPTPPNQVVMLRAPTQNDYQGFNIGDRWVVPFQSSGPSEQEWILMSKAQNIAVWVETIGGNSPVTYTDHELLVGTGTTTIDTIPSGTTGFPLISSGGTADPFFDVLTVIGGGTSNTDFVPYAPICGGTIDIGALQSVASLGNSGDILTSNGANMLPSFQAPGGGTLPVPSGGTGDTSFLAYAVVTGGITSVDPLQTVASLGTLNQVLTSQGNGALPIWTDNASGTGFTSIVSQVFTTTGTYTPTANMKYCIVEALGGGGGAGGSVANNVGGIPIVASGGGGAGGYCRKVIDAATIGVSQAVTIGAGGAGGSGNAAGSNGSDTTFGAILTGSGGIGSAQSVFTRSIVGGDGGAASGGDINVQGQSGGTGVSFFPGGSSLGFSGIGGDTSYGVGGRGITIQSAGNGNDGIGYGSGGSGSLASLAGSPTGGAGASGLVIVTEFIGA